MENVDNFNIVTAGAPIKLEFEITEEEDVTDWNPEEEEATETI